MVLSLDILHMLHKHLQIACRYPHSDENVHELLRLRGSVAQMIADWRGC
jgi:hypothetical protein